MIRMNGKTVDPSPMPFITGHNRCDDLFLDTPHQKQLRLDLPLAVNVALGIVPGNH
jgi:hypothetical protein